VSEVKLSVGGRIYRVACAPGEEEHVTRLGAVIDEKLASMGKLSGLEAQNLLFAALLLADEVHEGRDTVSRAEGEIAAAKALAGSAAGEIEELRTALGNSEAEVEQLQSDRNDAAHELEIARTRLAEVSDRLAERIANEEVLQSQVEALTQERDALAAGPQSPPAAASAEPDLAPALERLAEMLEQTADKLESGLRTT
jgi:cell division protein ZapA